MTIQEHARNPATPHPACEPAVTLLNGVAATTSTWTYATDIIPVDDARSITFYIDYDPHASSTAGAGAIMVFGSAEESPASGDDSWFAFTEVQAASTSLVTGPAPSGADWTITPESAVRKVHPLVLRTEAADNASDEFRLKITLDCTPDRHIQLAYKEIGDVSQPGTFIIKYVRSA